VAHTWTEIRDRAKERLYDLLADTVQDFSTEGRSYRQKELDAVRQIIAEADVEIAKETATAASQGRAAVCIFGTPE
jgi:hypothetical protein